MNETKNKYSIENVILHLDLFFQLVRSRHFSLPEILLDDQYLLDVDQLRIDIDLLKF
jgi:hypothetical protein